MKQYTNWAEGYPYSATYMTADGNENLFSYSGDYSSEPYKPEDILSFPREEAKRKTSSDEMSELIQNCEKFGTIQFTTQPFACDYGQHTVYSVKYNEQGNTKLIRLGSFGDVHSIPDDPYAQTICNFFGLKWDKQPYSSRS